MNKCPRCESDTLKIWNQCPKCGLKLEMTREQVIDQLKDLVKDRESFCVGDYDVVFELDIQALEYAIKELERTAQEVPIQEQSISSSLKCKITINGLNVLKNIDTDGSLKLDTICTGKTRIEINLLKA